MPSFWEIVLSNALLVVVLAVGVALLGRFWRNPLYLHLLWLLVLLKLITPPLVTVPVAWSAKQTAVLEEASRVGIAQQTPAPLPEPVGDVHSTLNVQKHLPMTNDRTLTEVPEADSNHVLLVTQRRPTPWLTLLGWAWGAGILLVAVVYTWRIVYITWLFRNGQKPPPTVLDMALKIAKRLELGRVPEICMLPVCVSPMVWSLGGRPRVFLPAALFERLDEAAQEAILAHELAHVRRKDHWIRLLEVIITTLFWWHPVAWWAAGRLRELEDQCCDRMVVDLAPCNAKGYATALLDTLDFLCDRSTPVPLGATAANSPRSLTRRIAMLSSRSFPSRWTLGRLTLLLIIVALPMALAFGQKPSDSSDSASTAKTIAPFASASPAAPIGSRMPKAGITLRVVDVPIDSSLASKLPSGGVILSGAEAKKLIDEAQSDTRANVVQAPRMETPLGQVASIMVGVGSGTLRCQIMPEESNMAGAVALQIWPDLLAQGQDDATVTDSQSRAHIHVELKPGEAVAFGGWGDLDSRDAKHVTAFLAQVDRIEPAENEQPVIEKRAVNKQVKDFPEKVDLSTPESAFAVYTQKISQKDVAGAVELSWVKLDSQDIQDAVKDIENAISLDTDVAKNFAQNLLDTEIVEVLTYKDDLATVITKSNLYRGRQACALQRFGRIDGQWKNIDWKCPENTFSTSVERAEEVFAKNKDALWQAFVKVRDEVQSGRTPVYRNAERAKQRSQPALSEAEKEDIKRWKSNTWRLSVDLDMPSLKPQAVQYAVLEDDPVPDFIDQVKNMRHHSHQQLDKSIDEARKEQIRDIQAMAGWNLGFKEITGDQLYLLTKLPDQASSFTTLSSNSPAGKRWLVTKTVQIDGKPVCWCIQVEVKTGELVDVTFDKDNTFDLRAVYDKAMEEPNGEDNQAP